MKADNSEYQLIGEKDGNLIVRVKHMDNQLTTITKVEGNIIFDFDHQQYNSDHQNKRHQDKFFATSLEDPDINVIDTLADRYSMEVTSVYGKDHLLDMLIKNEDDQLRQRLIKQLPDALDTLTSKQRYAVLSYYCMGLRKKQIANNMSISNVMAGRHVKAGLAKLRQFYRIKK
jgi:RNA polymerase sigma factor (sigma-70 family)